MCNDYGIDLPFRLFVEAFEELGMAVDPDAGPPNLEPRDEIWPTERAPVIRLGGAGVRLEMLRWGLKSGRANGPPVINLRGEGRNFAQGRCLIPASHFYEFTGSTRPKTRWRFTKTGEAWFCIAGVIGVADDKGEAAPAFSMLTTAPGPDVAPIHNRQVVILPRCDWVAWLRADRPASDLMIPSVAGTLTAVLAPRPHAGNTLVLSNS